MYKINNNVHVYSLKLSIDKYMYMYYNITIPNERGMVMKQEYIEKISKEMNKTEDIAMLDLILQILIKSRGVANV